MEALRRIQNNTIEKRLLNSRGLPNFNVKFYVINKAGEYAGVALYSHDDAEQYAVCTENGPALASIDPLLEGSST